MDSNQGYNPYKWVICPLTRVINLHITSYNPYPEPLSMFSRFFFTSPSFPVEFVGFNSQARKSELDPNVAVMNATLGAVGSGSQWVMGTQQWEVWCGANVSNENIKGEVGLGGWFRGDDSYYPYVMWGFFS